MFHLTMRAVGESRYPLARVHQYSQTSISHLHRAQLQCQMEYSNDNPNCLGCRFDRTHSHFAPKFTVLILLRFHYIFRQLFRARLF